MQSPAISAAAVDAGCFDFGEVAVAVGSESRDWVRLVRQRYDSFATGQAPELRITYSVDDPRPPTPDFLYAARQQPLRARRRGSRLLAAGASFKMELDRRRGAARLTGRLATYPVDHLIQALWYETHDSGLIFHAAALAGDGAGWLLSGPSGSGKSTLAGLFPKHAMCDELAAVRLEGGSPRLTALPFWTGRKGSVPLAAIYLLRHDRRHRRRRLSPGEAVRRLRRQVVWPTFDPDALRRAFTALFDLLGQVPVWELGFRPEPEVWHVLARETGR